MQTAAYRPPPMASAFSMSATEPVRTSVAHLLTRTDGIPCMAAAQAFTQLVQPASRFTVSLDLLLPILSGNSEEASVLDHANVRFRSMVCGGSVADSLSLPFSLAMDACILAPAPYRRSVHPVLAICRVPNCD